MLSHRLGVLLVVVLLKKQIGVGGEEGVRWLFRRDHRDSMMILRAKAAEEVEHLASLLQGLVDVAEGVDELLEAANVHGDVHVALNEIVEFGLQVHGTMKLVVVEFVLDVALDDVSSRPRHTDDREGVLGDRVVEPDEHALIHDLPLVITVLG